MWKKSIVAALAVVVSLASFSSWSAPQEPVNLEQLLQQLQQGKFSQSKENQEREARFRAQADAQERLLREAMAERDQLERLSEQLESQFEGNEMELASRTDTLTKRMGS